MKITLVALVALLLVTTPRAVSAPLDGPTTPVLDSFGRPDEDPLSQAGNWAPASIDGSGPTLEVIGGTAGHDEGAGAGDSYRSLDAAAGDVEVYGTIAVSPDDQRTMSLFLDLQEAGTAGVDGYEARWFHWIARDGLYVRKVVDGVSTNLPGSPVEIPNADDEPAGGHALLFRRVGSALELWHRRGTTWSLRLGTSDGSYRGGRIGLGTTGSKARWDDFGGGGSGAPPPPPPPPPPISDDPPLEQSHGICDGRGIHAIATSRCLSDPVNTLTGAFVTSAEDLAVPGTGVGFGWVRTYTSSDSTSGRLGPGWTDGYDVSLDVQANGDVRLHGDEGQVVQYARQPDGSFLGAPGALSVLRSTANGFELVRSDQVVYGFDAAGRLLAVEDRNGQGLTFIYENGRLAAVVDAAGRRATISHGAEGLVSGVETEDGRRVSYAYSGGRLQSFTDVRGQVWQYRYDTAGRLATIDSPTGERLSNVYGADGRVSSQTDALGSTTTFAWDASTQTATVTDANGHEWKDDYEANVLVARVDPLGNATRFAHDSDLNTSGVTSPGGETTSMTYDERGNLLVTTAPPSLGNARKSFLYNPRNDPTQVTDARGTVTSYAYDARGNAERIVQDGTEFAAYTYDGAGRVVSSTDGNGKTTTFAYDGDGNLASETDPLGNTTTYTYDDAGRVLTRVDPRGNAPGANPAAFTWRWTYDAAGQILTERDPLGALTTHTYDAAGNELTTTDAKGMTTTLAYDDAGRLVSETQPDPDGAGPLPAPVVTYAYDDVGNKTAQMDVLGRTTTFAYDDANRPVSTTSPDPDGSGPLAAPVTTTSYDERGNAVGIVEPRGNAAGARPDDFRTRFAYDAAGRLVTTTDPLGSVTENVFDAVGNLASVRDANGRTTSFTHDAAGRVLSVTGPDGGITAYTYDDVGNRLTRRDANGHVTTYAYDGAGRLVAENGPDPDGPGPQGPAQTTHAYDPNGNLVCTIDPNGNATAVAGDGRTSFAYDAADRLVAIDYSDATPDVTFSYDAVGNRVSMTDGSGTETRSYDGLGRLATVSRGPNTFSYGYDAVGNVTRRTYPGGTATEYGYDALSRLSSVASSGQTTTYGYDVASNLTQTTLPAGNGHVEARTYDRAGRLTEVRNQKGSTVLSHFLSTLDPVGNPTRVVRAGSLAETHTYTYDADDRITGVCFQAGACPGSSDPFIRWTYDGVGNRLSEQRPNGATTAYTYDARDRLLAAGSTSFAYDENGNQTRKGTRTFTYDLANRLRTTTQGATTTTYAYDGEGKRVEASGEGAASPPTLRTPCSTAIGSVGAATVSRPAGTVAGDLLIVGIAFEKGTDSVVTPPSGWTLIRRTNQSSDVGYATYRKLAGGSEPASYAFGLTNSPKWSIGSCAVSGVDPTTPIDVHNGAFGLSGNPSAPSVTTTGPSRLLLAFHANKKAATFSSHTSPAVERWDAPNPAGGLPSNAMASYELPAAGASGAKSAVASEQEKWVAQQIAIAPVPGAGISRFLWDPSFGLPQLALERDAGNSPLRSYTYGARRISQTAGSNTSYFLYDALGSVANLTSALGATQWTYAYEPFGGIRGESSNSGPANFLKFTGEYLDPTGLYHLRARQYDPALGRFLSTDPASAATGGGSSYVYVLNQPLVLRDPSGATFEPVADGPDRALDATSPAPVLEPPLTQLWRLPCAARPGHPLGRVGRFLGGPYQGTHTRGNWQSDRAVDISVPVGTRVCAIFGGRIGNRIGPLRSSEPALAGLRLTLEGRSDDAYYAHLSRIWVKAKERVRKGQVLGLSGSANGSPHLHLALHYGNPTRYCRADRILGPCF